MANRMYFSAEREVGYSKQLEVDFDAKTVRVGYCLANFQTFHKVNMKEIERLKNDFVGCGFTLVK